MDTPTIVQLIITTILVIVTAIYAWRTHVISKASIEQVNATKQMTEEMRDERRSSIFVELAQQANIINEAAARYKIRGPYAILLNIKPDDAERFGGSAALFFHHVNLLHLVYRNRAYLGENIEEAYRKWVREIVRPWLESDQNLVEIWNLTRESKDLLGKGFIEWLEPELPIHRKKAE